jgi:MYXO-CTERM domain-containing protein
MLLCMPPYYYSTGGGTPVRGTSGTTNGTAGTTSGTAGTTGSTPGATHPLTDDGANGGETSTAAGCSIGVAHSAKGHGVLAVLALGLLGLTRRRRQAQR